MESDGLAHVVLEGQPRPLVFPARGNTAQNIRSIFSGLDYPLIPLAGFAPKLIVDIAANFGATALYFLDLERNTQSLSQIRWDL